MLRNLLIFVTFLWLPSFALAQDLPRPLSDTVSDYDDLLPMEEEIRLSNLLREARAETGIHTVLVTMARRENHGGAGRSIEDYTKLLFNQWGVGDAARDDGILILISTSDREMRVQLGSGFGTEWDGVAFGLIQEQFIPLMREGQLVEGISRGTEAVIDHIARPFSRHEGPPSGLSSSDDTSVMDMVLVGGVFLLAFGAIAARFVGDQLVKLRPCPQCGFSGGMRRRRKTLLAAKRTSEGQGVQIISCNKCGYRDEQPYSIAAEGDDDHGGGFGGGRSSGGGATGRW